MAHASAPCPHCRNESISMSSSKLAYDRRDMHVARAHPEKGLPTHPYRDVAERRQKLVDFGLR